MTSGANGVIIVRMELTNRYTTNRSQIDGWLWRARHALRKRNTRLACEAMLSALWLMGANQ